MPPSTTRSTPATYDESSDARNTAAVAISSGLPKRCIGCCDKMVSLNPSTSCCERPMRSKMGVAIGPRLTALTGMFSGRSSEEKEECLKVTPTFLTLGHSSDCVLLWRYIIAKKPNLLFIFTDQQRFDTIRCYGNDFV